MKIGTILKYRHNGDHVDSRIVVLNDKNTNRRFLYNIDYNVRVGYWIALYAKPTGEIAAKKSIDEYLKKCFPEKC